MKKIVTLVIILISVLSYSQQDAQFSNYMYNTLIFNPAYAGSRGTTSIYLSQRSQWVGLEGAPKTNSLSYHSPIGSSNLGLGLSILNDEIGPVLENMISSNIGIGMFWYSDRSYLGFSIPNLLETRHINKGLSASVSSVSKERLHYHFTAGYLFDITQDVLFKPAVLTKIVS